MAKSDKEKILEKLKEILDPELGYDIVSLGMIEDVKLEKDKVFIKILPTTPFCPYLPLLTEMINSKVKELGYDCEIEIDLENVWSLDRVSDEIRKEFNI